MLALRRCRPTSSVIKSIASQYPLSKLYLTPIAVRHAAKSASNRTKKIPSSVSENTKTKKRPSTRTKSNKDSEIVLSSEPEPEPEPEPKQHQEGVVLRPYQEECVAACLEALQDGITRIGVSSPTGSGKTTMFTSLIEQLPALENLPYSSNSTSTPAPGNRVLIIVPSIELALQAARTVSDTHPDLSVEIEQGSNFVASGVADVTVATYQTLHRSEDRLNKFDPRGFKAIIVDEAHHAAAPSYLSVLSHFDPSINVSLDQRKARDMPKGKGKESSSHLSSTSGTRKIPIIGFSATFSRHDGLALGTVFDRIVYHRDLLDMIEEKWLCPVRFTSIKADMDLSSVKLGAFGDFATSSLASVVNTPAVNRLIVRSWLDRAWTTSSPSSNESSVSATSTSSSSTSSPSTAHGKRRSTLVFCVNIDHVEQLTHEFRMAGIDARYLHGRTIVAERRRLLEDFRSGLFPVLVNCSILTEGADVPSIDCVLLARPTRSRNIFSQMIGRGLRLSAKSGKKDCLILDVVGSIEKGVVCVPTLFGLDVTEDIEDEDLFSLRQKGLDLNPSNVEEDPALTSGSPKSLEDPSKVTYVDYDDPWELHKAMVRGNTGIVERMSRNAWVDCGGDVYVLDIPTAGFIRVERNDEESKNEEDDEADDWVSRFTPKNSGSEEAEIAAAAARSWPFTRRRTASPYRRARHVLYSSTLDAAIRGSDTYATSRVLRGGPMSNLLSRFAPWRMKPASEKQRAFVEKRLRLIGSKQVNSMEAVDESSAEASSEKKTKGSSRNKSESALPNLTKGQASTVLTRLQHGAKSRWEKEAKIQNRILLKEEKEAKRRDREVVKVGDL